MGLRTKIGAAITVTAALVAVLIGFVVHHRTAVNQLAAARETITARLASAVEDHAAGFDRPHTLVNPGGLPEPLRRAAEERRTATYLDRGGPEPVLWAATRLGDDVIALRRPYHRETRDIKDLDDVLWAAGGLGTAFSGIVGVGLAAFAGRRIDASARTAERIAEGDLTARLRPRGGRDEIARLTVAVNRMADALAARLQAEREVTANIAHELRTPVAGLVAAAALLPPGRPAEMVQERARRVRTLVEDVLEVARLDADAERADTEVRALGDLARRAVAAVAAAAGPGRAPAEVRVLDDRLVETDPRRVERILTNLVTNAFRHGAGPVVAEVDGGVVRVRDGGPGFPPQLLAHGPQRFRTDSGSGLGLGLTIAVGQARVLGAGLAFENPEGGGAQAVLDLREAVRGPVPD
ncbi:sensor histidine kinase [Streptomyces caatingaensis]|uniref:histidine kinase n=1 Tax=Streptomyces caatingaensis TaxID=1678637 RepID=A0A0K9XM79_9ACTN|nr:HAMP domain-containing sensor histidine kinase [Streptomyces caatingaensis]KNB54435.1 histidine kinase [Streptomyces caatingaensis]